MSTGRDDGTPLGGDRRHHTPVMAQPGPGHLGVVVTYVEVNGLPTWHEVSGEGVPVVLLHGAFAGASSWSAQAPALARAGYKVHVPERRGHAHTPDVEGPLTYDAMADDTVAYLDGVVGGPAHLATALRRGRLAVLPGTHALPVEVPAVVNTLLLWFLAGAAPAVDWSVTGPGR
jgi:alpha/beta hydrolase family protein